MPPVSSFIFVVILAVWAVYLVQHWVRRREHVATARSVDRFSDAMRVLERRRALPRPDIAEQAPAAYSVSPLRPARPEVVVKRGVSAPAAETRPAAGRDARPATSEQGRPAATRPLTGATAVRPTPALRRARRAAQVRAIALLGASVVMVALVSLGVSPVLDWWWGFVGVGVLAATLLLVRRSAASQRARRARTRAAAPSRKAGASLAQPAMATDGDTRTSPQAEVAPPAEVAVTAEADESPLAAQARAAAAPRSARRVVDLEPARPAIFDIDEVEAGLVARTAGAASAQAQVADDAESPAAPGSWSPTPVPPPTYTLKAKAYRGAAQPATGSTQLPADGTEMALEEEFEDLPQIHRVG
ncbi:hypothetical protein [Serinicoccus kebangsaanensis]|uniref:hypothetical protein n=1 Tax=Serinicoccus kebangsaanensis TaxID=2602069 RepID=UPI00124EA6B5|nr:hypothetical protein [Serinicoccus kebangsaanensis]